jgi:hypothetical protein
MIGEVGTTVSRPGIVYLVSESSTDYKELNARIILGLKGSAINISWPTSVTSHISTKPQNKIQYLSRYRIQDSNPGLLE